MQIGLFDGEGGDGDGGGGNGNSGKGGGGRSKRVEDIALFQAARSRYLNYALSVITSRALPDVRDGLKPVQRRILYGMYNDLRLRADSRYLKSARVVGEVMGKYHPHGDQSIYDAMVRLAQSFSLRYPLVDGQGNFGSIDGDSAAAMRYTETRLRSLAEELLSEIRQQTTAFRPSYDGQLFEPVVLPAQAPNLLINGATGIAVGMATNIPPHNLREVASALLTLIDAPDAPLETLCEHIRGPDFPTGGEILSGPAELMAVYASGHGPVKLRGQYKSEIINRRRCIVLVSIPYTVNKSSLVEKIASLIIQRNLPQLVDVRDESTDDVRIVLELKRGAAAEVVMAYLYKHTSLQQNFNVNLTCLVPTDNPEVSAPQRVGLIAMLRYFLDFRLEVVTRRLEFQLRKLQERIHILEGLAILFDALDEAIALIRASKSKADAAKRLIKRFPIDAIQADHILELKLYRLARLEVLTIRTELKGKQLEAEHIATLLESQADRWKLVRSEIAQISDAYGDERRTALVGPPEAESFDPDAYIVRERTWVIVSRNGRIKRQRGFSDVSAIRVPEGDEVGWTVRTDTTHTISLYTELGRAYVLRADDIISTTGFGEPVQSFFNFADGERIVGVSCSDPLLTPTLEKAVELSQAGQDEASEASNEPELNGAQAASSAAPSPSIEQDGEGPAADHASQMGETEGEGESGASEEPAAAQEVGSQEGDDEGEPVGAPGDRKQPDPPFGVAVTRLGKTVRFPLSAHNEVSNRNGRRFMAVGQRDSGDGVIAVLPCAGDELLTLATEGGRVLIFPVAHIPPRAGAARGVNAIRLQPADRVLGFQLTRRKRSGLKTFTTRGRELIVRETSYRVTSRGGKGAIVLRKGRLERCEWPVVTLQPPSEELEEEATSDIEGAEEELEASQSTEDPERAAQEQKAETEPSE